MKNRHKVFIESRLFKQLQELGHDVAGFDITEGDDLLDLKKTEEAIQKVKITYYF